MLMPDAAPRIRPNAPGRASKPDNAAAQRTESLQKPHELVGPIDDPPGIRLALAVICCIPAEPVPRAAAPRRRAACRPPVPDRVADQHGLRGGHAAHRDEALHPGGIRLPRERAVAAD